MAEHAPATHEQGARKSVEVSTRVWDFYAVHAPTAFGFTWHWRREGADPTVTSAPFTFYFDCIADARANGYAGSLPRGPKVPLLHLPAGSMELTRAASKLRAGHAALPLTTAAPTAAVKPARTRGRSPG